MTFLHLNISHITLNLNSSESIPLHLYAPKFQSASQNKIPDEINTSSQLNEDGCLIFSLFLSLE